MSLREPMRMPWKQAWKVLESWRCLHRVAVVVEVLHADEYDGDAVHVAGTACCGAHGHFAMPGLFSRMGLRRCAHCSRIAGVDPSLPGIPGNGEPSGPMDAWQVKA